MGTDHRLSVFTQVFILDALSDYTPKDSKEAEETIERVTPRLQHANCAVVLSAVKVCSKCYVWTLRTLTREQPNTS